MADVAGSNPLTMIWPIELWKGGWNENPNLDTMVLWCFSKSKLFLIEDWISPTLMLNKFVPNLKRHQSHARAFNLILHLGLHIMLKYIKRGMFAANYLFDTY